MQVEYIIVGLGLAGLAFTQKLTENNHSFLVFEDNSQHASKVASGVYNPVVLKRYTPVWNAHSQLQTALSMYEGLERQFNNKYDYKFEIYRLLNSIQEQNDWIVATDRPVNDVYMLPTISEEKFKGINAPFGFGKLHKTGKIDTISLLDDYRTHLKNNAQLQNERFDYKQIQFEEDCVIYKGIKAKRIVFCEGYGIKENPFFKHLPLVGTKGELITIHAPELDIDYLVKSSVFVLPMQEKGCYKIGATFEWTDKTSIPTEEGKNELTQKLDTFINVPYKVVDQHAGIRPTVKDRRPLVGVHPEHQQLAVLNGLGTRGVMLAPTMAIELYDHLELDKALSEEINITRFSGH